MSTTTTKKRVNITLSEEFEKVLELLAGRRDVEDAKYVSHGEVWMQPVVV